MGDFIPDNVFTIFYSRQAIHFTLSSHFQALDAKISFSSLLEVVKRITAAMPSAHKAPSLSSSAMFPRTDSGFSE